MTIETQNRPNEYRIMHVGGASSSRIELDSEERMINL
mgnify:CR=1 FL=1